MFIKHDFAIFFLGGFYFWFVSFTIHYIQVGPNSDFCNSKLFQVDFIPSSAHVCKWTKTRTVFEIILTKSVQTVFRFGSHRDMSIPNFFGGGKIITEQKPKPKYSVQYFEETPNRKKWQETTSAEHSKNFFRWQQGHANATLQLIKHNFFVPFQTSCIRSNFLKRKKKTPNSENDS